MRIITANIGSTSVKYAIFDDGGITELKTYSRKKINLTREEKNFLEYSNADYFVLRIVNGFDLINPTYLTQESKESVLKGKKFAPLHNKIALEIMDFLSFFTNKIILVFDTEFHQTLPPKAYLYPIDYRYIQKYGLRKYGYHGLALESVMENLKKQMKSLPGNIIAVHAGGGVSVTAIKKGKSVDTTMGATPTDGIFMLTRSGSIDPEVVRIIQESENMLPSEVSDLLNNRSGFYGLTGSKDTKFIIERAKEGDEPYKSAYELFLYQIQKQIFAFSGVLGSVDIITLSGGLGFENRFFKRDLYSKIKHLPIREEQILKVEVDEHEIMLKKAIKLIKYNFD